MRNVNVNQVVGYRERGVSRDVVVVEIQWVKRGRHAGEKKYTLAPLTPAGNAYGFACVGEVCLAAPSGTYTPAEIAAAVCNFQRTARHASEIREQIVEKRVEKLEEKRVEIGDIAPGDEVLVRYSDIGTRWEEVAEINLRTGKIGIVRRGAREHNERAAHGAARTNAFPFGGKPRKAREVRWLPPGLIIQVRHPAKAEVGR